MKKLLLVAATLLSVHAFADPQTGPTIDPAYSQLKTFRTYYLLNSVTDLLQHFAVRFKTARARSVLAIVSGNSADDIASSTVRYSGDLAQEFPSVPAALAPLTAAVEARIRKDNPGATEVQMSYAGEYATLSMIELIPTQPNTQYRSFASWIADYDMTPNGSLTLDPQSSSAGTGLFCYSSCKKPPVWIDVSLSPTLEGTSILNKAEYNIPLSPAQTLEWVNIQAKAIQAVNAVKTNTYVDPLPAILARQGNTIIPPQFSQTVRFVVDLIGRTEDFSKQKDMDVDLSFATQQAYDQGVSVEQAVPEFDLKVAVKGSLKTGAFTFTLTKMASGESKSIEYQADTSSLIIEGGVVAVPGDMGFQRLGPPPSQEEQQHGLVLPGTGIYQSIEVRPGSGLGDASARHH